MLAICGNSHESYEIMKCRLHNLVDTLNNIIHHSLEMAEHFALHPEHLIAPHLCTFYTTVLQFLHSLHFDRKPLIIRDGFPQL
jgi:hypothetical protein